jgi:hypothetical protein
MPVGRSNAVAFVQWGGTNCISYNSPANGNRYMTAPNSRCVSPYVPNQLTWFPYFKAAGR